MTEGCGPCEEAAPTPNEKKIFKPDHAGAEHSLPSFLGQLQRLKASLEEADWAGPLPLPLPFFVNIYLILPARKSIYCFSTPGRATNEIAGDPDQLWPASEVQSLLNSFRGPCQVELPSKLLSNLCFLYAA